MATEKQKEAARRNLKQARKVQSERARGADVPQSSTMNAARENRLPDTAFAFRSERKEPLTDARHVRNAIARFDQVEGVSDHERDLAWGRIRRAAKRFDVEIEADSWRELGHKAKRR
jgi:hypothetical protein